jgi:D-sedoheptulose 7-phosphate isomerase
MNKIRNYLDLISEAVSDIDDTNIISIVNYLTGIRNSNHNIFLIGNGGSALNASHLALELLKEISMLNNQKPFNVINLCDNIGIFSAWANDLSFNNVFYNQLKLLGKAGDVLILFSTLGKSANILSAIEIACLKQMNIISFVGKEINETLLKSNFIIKVSSIEPFIIESVHLAVIHSISNFLKIN